MCSKQGCQCFPFRRRPARGQTDSHATGSGTPTATRTPSASRSDPNPSRTDPRVRSQQPRRHPDQTSSTAQQLPQARVSEVATSTQRTRPETGARAEQTHSEIQPGPPTQGASTAQPTARNTQSVTRLWRRKPQADSTRSPRNRNPGPSELPKEQRYGLRVLYEPEDTEAIVDIVLIHGLTGHPYNTWYEDSRQVFWPEEYLSNDFPQARIMTFGYGAEVMARNLVGAVSQNRLRDHAQDLLNDLVDCRRTIDPVRSLFLSSNICHAKQGI